MGTQDRNAATDTRATSTPPALADGRAREPYVRPAVTSLGRWQALTLQQSMCIWPGCF